jgi:predicted nucleic acid-binding protein
LSAATLRAERSGRADSLIAATALVHGPTVVIRNHADLEPAGIAVIDPFAS